jgi:RND family efflux transporter MFP subunit
MVSGTNEALIGITKPAQEASLGPVSSSRIMAIPAPEGAMVEAGDLLISFDDAIQQARVDAARADSESTLDVELAEARWRKVQHDYDRLMNLQGSANASTKELNDVRIDVNVARIEYELARFNLAQSKLSYERELALLRDLHIRAPFAGYIAEQFHFAGESLDQQDVVLRIVQLDPLHVTVDCPLALAPHLVVGQQVEVSPVEEQWRPRAGRIILTHRVANAASQTFRVKIAVPNEDLAWMAGIKVAVDFAAVVGQPRPVPGGDRSE